MMKGKREYACVNVHYNTGGGRDVYVCVGGGGGERVKMLKHGVLQSKYASIQVCPNPSVPQSKCAPIQVCPNPSVPQSKCASIQV